MKTNKEIRQVVKEKFNAVRGKLILYSFVYLIIFALIGLIPILGSLSSLLSALCAIGYVATVVNIYNGKGENETPVSFFNHTGKLIGNYICSDLWIMLKCIVGIIIAIVGVVIMYVGGAGSMVALMTMGSSSDAGYVVGGLGLAVIIGGLLYLAGLIVFIVMAVKYATISYEIVHDNKSGKKARELVAEAEQHLKGHVGQWICMAIYYGLLLFLVSLVAGLVCGFVGGIIGGVLNVAYAAEGIVALLSAIVVVVLESYFLPLITCALEELYQELMGGRVSEPTPVPQEEVQASSEESPIQ